MHDTDDKHLTHLNESGEAHMVDVGAKAETVRVARASACVRMEPETLALITSGEVPKGDVFATARIAGIMAAKRTHELIPLCHPLALTSVTVELAPSEDCCEGDSCVDITTEARTTGRTGVEMEALVAASVAALTIYDMCKAVDRGMVIDDAKLLYKEGGKSGVFDRESEERDD